ncbi:MAG TPA: OPT/YSL family transporter, partial [Phycisphaerales bacterium]|nr:OPT/YSL family transporter [Phycisphaerales bacterium]
DRPWPARSPRETSSGAYREVTVASIVFGVVVGGVMNAAITYAGLKIGFTIVGSAIAAVLGFGVLRGILRRGSILETNIGQTIASAVNTTNAGVIFTVPVLLLLGYSLDFGEKDFWLITLACVAGALLGCVFIVPLRKQMLDIDRLRFPSATAVGAILKSPGAGARKSIVLAVGILVGMIVYFPTAAPSLNLPGYASLGLRLKAEVAPGAEPVEVNGEKRPALTIRADRDRDGVPDLIVSDTEVDVGRWLGLPDEMTLAFAIAPFAIGAGYLTGRAGLLVLAGGVLAYIVLNPLAFNMGWMPATVRADQASGYALNSYNRPLGIGLLLGGAMMGIVASFPAIREAFKGLAAASRTGSASPRSLGGADELGFKPLVLIGSLAMVMLIVASEFSGSGGTSQMTGWLQGVHPWLARGIICLVAAAWIWFAGIIIAQCAGMTDWSPISGMALLTVVLVMLLAGREDVVSAVMIGAALCVAISCASDMMADLKTGYIVGSVPRRQQIVEIATVAIGPVITMFTIVLIASVNLRQTGIPIGPGTETVAPQAQALEVVIRGVQGGEMPYTLY